MIAYMLSWKKEGFGWSLLRPPQKTPTKQIIKAKQIKQEFEEGYYANNKI